MHAWLLLKLILFVLFVLLMITDEMMMLILRMTFEMVMMALQLLAPFSARTYYGYNVFTIS
jgi:hypothetical protein